MTGFAQVRCVLFFNCTEEEMEKRLIERGKTSGRSDDNIASIKKRFVTYQQQSYPIIQHFEKLGLVKEILSIGSVEDIFVKALAALTSCFPSVVDE
jgi:UMP-CMP kinase